MAHSLSAKKRIRQNAKCRARNRWRKASYRDAIKDYRELILHGSVEESETKLKEIYKLLDQTAPTPAMHRNTASRYKSRLSAQLNKKRVATG
ncbi:MAG: 30S ribosomal protein S20 [Planctomycetota bacterium]